jgi:hypothetical protein
MTTTKANSATENSTVEQRAFSSPERHPVRVSARIILAVLVVVLGVNGCDLFEMTEEKSSSYGTRKVYDGYYADDPLYISLASPGSPRSTGGSDDWDIMIHNRKEILTNSGVTATAESSGGQGGVVFAGTTRLKKTVTIPEAEALFADAAASSGMDKGVDFSYYSKYKTTSTAGERLGNAMSFPGFRNQDGRDGETDVRAWVYGEPGAHVDADFSRATAFARWEMMAPNYSSFNDNVYIIRSGDGERYYKFQVNEVVYVSEGMGMTRYTFDVRFAEILR